VTVAMMEQMDLDDWHEKSERKNDQDYVDGIRQKGKEWHRWGR